MSRLPYSLYFALSLDDSAIENFVNMEEDERAHFVARAKRCATEKDVEILAMSLADINNAEETY